MNNAARTRKKKQETNLAEVRVICLGGLVMSKQVEWCVIPNQDRSQGVVMV